MKLTVAQIIALQHATWHSLSKPIAECRDCKRLRKRLAYSEGEVT